MTDDLLPVEAFNHGRGLNPQVQTSANPSAAHLLRARGDLQRNEGLASLFIDATAKGWDQTELTWQLKVALQALWLDADPSEAAEYLVAEYYQLGEGVHVVSTDTGRVLAVLDPETDTYQPALVPREHGGLAQPLRRIRPDLEAALILWGHTKEREEAAVAKLAAQGHQTALLRDLGDPRLLVATRKGRQQIVNEMTTHDPKTLLQACGGTAAAFLGRFLLVAEAPEDVSNLNCVKGIVSSKSVTRIQDQLTVNLQHNRAGTLRGALIQGWVREIARKLSEAVSEGAPVQDIDTLHHLEPNLWILPPELVGPFRKIAPVTALPVEGACPTGISGNVGYLVIPHEFQAKSLERFDRWEAVSELAFELWFNPMALKPLNITGVAFETQVL
jgi:hypothetical protein